MMIVYPSAPVIAVHAKQHMALQHLLYTDGPIISLIKPKGSIKLNDNLPTGSGKGGKV